VGRGIQLFMAEKYSEEAFQLAKLSAPIQI
jgi:hypothetical protein